MTSKDRRLKLTILGGFLGSGKTTWLRHQLHEGRFAKAHIIVNEAAGTPIDDSLLGLAGNLTVLAGGCACCAGSAGFEAALLALCDARSKPGDPARDLQEVVLETSGVAEPAAIVRLVQSHPVLIRHILVSGVTVIVDALYGRTALSTEPLARAQISAADSLILSKTEAADAGDVAELRGILSKLAPAAVQTGASFGSPTQLPDAREPALGLPPCTQGSAGPIRVCQLDLGTTPDWTALTLWLSAILHARGHQIVRVKGVIASPAGDLLVQAVRNTVQSPEKLPDRSRAVSANKLVLIGTDLDCDGIQRSYERVGKAG